MTLFFNAISEKKADQLQEKKNSLIKLTTDEIIKSNKAYNKTVQDSQDYVEFVDNFIEKDPILTEILDLGAQYKEIVAAQQSVLEELEKDFDDLVQKSSLEDEWGISITRAECSVKDLARREQTKKFPLKTTCSWTIRDQVEHLVNVGGKTSLKDIAKYVEAYNGLAA